MSSTDYSSDDSSDRSYRDPGQRRFCAFQTGRFHGHECSRYFDCPGHTIERAASDPRASEDEEEEGEDEDQEIDDYDETDDDADQEELDDSADLPDVLRMETGEMAAFQRAEEISQVDEGDEARDLGDESQGVIDLTTSSSPQQRRSAPRDSEHSSNLEHGGVAQAQSRSHDMEVIDLTEDSPVSPLASGSGPGAESLTQERALPTIPTSATSSNTSLPTSGAISPSAHRRPITPPEPPPPIRRRTSTNNFGTAPRPSIVQPPRPSGSRRPSDVVLPRWQPDAEVTFCPICRTQFSVFIRKHHCRYESIPSGDIAGRG